MQFLYVHVLICGGFIEDIRASTTRTSVSESDFMLFIHTCAHTEMHRHTCTHVHSWLLGIPTPLQFLMCKFLSLHKIYIQCVFHCNWKHKEIPYTAPQHLVCRAVQSLHINHMQMSIIEVFICRRLHMNTSMILICIWLICRLCTALHTKCCGAVIVIGLTTFLRIYSS